MTDQIVKKIEKNLKKVGLALPDDVVEYLYLLHGKYWAREKGAECKRWMLAGVGLHMVAGDKMYEPARESGLRVLASLPDDVFDSLFSLYQAGVLVRDDAMAIRLAGISRLNESSLKAIDEVITRSIDETKGRRDVSGDKRAKR